MQPASISSHLVDGVSFTKRCHLTCKVVKKIPELYIVHGRASFTEISHETEAKIKDVGYGPIGVLPSLA